MKTLRRCGQIGLAVLAMALAGRAEGAVDCARDGRPDRVIAGRATHSAAWYLNLAPPPASRSITP